ncbi:MAG: GNAT family N-acetyltransferase [Rickettsiales bacterium]|nr:GNAT family N-acetyltransferase [Rickettsiales bacterium]
MNFEIIEPNEVDLLAISDLYRECFKAPDKGENWTKESAYQYFQERLSEKSIFAVLKNEVEEIIGVCCGSLFLDSFISNEITVEDVDSFYISLIAISPAEQGRGYATKMVQRYCRMLRQQKHTSLIVRCRVENLPIQSILQKNDFVEFNRYQAELGGIVCERVMLINQFS